MTTDNAGAPEAPASPLPGAPTRPEATVPTHRKPRTVRRAAPAARPPKRRPGRNVPALLTADSIAVLAAAAVLDGAGQTLAALGPGLLALPLLHAHRGLYDARIRPSALDEAPRLARHCVVAWCASAALLASVRPASALGWATLLTAVVVHVVLACAGRGAVHFARRRHRRRNPHSTLVVADAAPAGLRITTALLDHPEYGMRPVGLVHPDREPADAPVPVLHSPEDITRAVIQNSVRDAVFTHAPWGDPESALLADLFTAQGCTVWQADTGSSPARGRGSDPGHVWGFACRRVGEPVPPRAAVLGKRILDVALSGLALAVLWPLLLACAIAVRRSDGPGVIFRQERIGMGGRRFTVLKFRTLRPADEHESATRWNVAHDNRMSAAGRFLRRSSLDELPQLWNVLRGDMSLVGPRPERPFFVARFTLAHPGYAARHRMPVGITGLAQVHGLRGDTSIEDRARFDNHYIETWSLWQDVRILLRTAGSFLRPGGN
ncbi:sugar transferase [Streptomyces meridianus]|uniref:Sugar transferase n=1 Tax=Streptomyces meridianus TaxID=2938945 RepID=A0ABT0X7G9_9ACTN|nr:sugar transferase [Streptomyces meridianus]MCM2578235.1 sugar transferase [Streptomyces meridianus]